MGASEPPLPGHLPADQQLRDGLAVVDKDAGWTSHDVAAKARGILRNRKVGHSGTLDPDATGVLLLGIGRATRLLKYLTVLPKTYTAEFVLGTETDTLDDSGEVVATHDMAAVTDDQVRAAAAALTGPIMQVPPMVSAVKVDGRRLHELARQGIEVEREARPVTVHRFEIEPLDGPGGRAAGVYRVEVECSSGTYVRTLAADLGHALGGGAHLRNLRRTAIGSFTLDEARPLADLLVRPMRDVMRDYPSVVVSSDVAEAVGFGKVLDRAALGVAGDAEGPAADGPWAVLDEAGDLLAVYEAHKGTTVKPSVVVAPATGGSRSPSAEGAGAPPAEGTGPTAE
ncbi:MAG: tRNA pseudouridine(55) synthase TruB [Acidimicrobiales bacterium]